MSSIIDGLRLRLARLLMILPAFENQEAHQEMRERTWTFFTTTTYTYYNISISSMRAEAIMCWNGVLEKCSEITQYKGHYAVQGHSRSPILAPIAHICILRRVFSILARHRRWPPHETQPDFATCSKL